MSKSEFAAHIGVVPSRITKMIADEIIGADVVGSGRAARVLVERAKQQIAARRNPGQALANGLTTKVHDAGPGPATLELPLASDLPRQLQEERLENERRKNRIAAREEALALGQLVPAEQVRAEIGRVLQVSENFNAGLIADFASAIAGAYGLSQRDLVHLLRKVRSEKRAGMAERARTNADAAQERGGQVGHDVDKVRRSVGGAFTWPGGS